MNLEDVVQDWGGFEELIKDLHDGGDILAERDVTLIGASGASRQIDVLLKHNKGPYQYMTLIECKYWSKKVERKDIDVMYSGMQDLNASKGVFFTTKGYQSGAEVYAKSKGIDIFVVRDLSNTEWGLPGKIIDLYLQIVSKTVLSINTKNTRVAYQVGVEAKDRHLLAINMGTKERKNIILSSHKERYEILEDYLEAACNHAVKELNKTPFVINSGEECTRYFQIEVNMPFKEKGDELRVFSESAITYIPSITMNVGIKIDQSRIIFDRSKKYIYALAIEDCVNNKVHMTSKKSNDKETQWDILKQNSNEDKDDVVVNGSIISVTTKNFFDPKEMDGLTEVDFVQKEPK